MIEFPSIPAWGEFHPLLVHFPIALLLVAPLFILIGMFIKKNARYFNYSALILMGLGFLSLVIAIASGEASADLVPIPKNAAALVEKHKELSETARNIYAGLIIIYFLIITVPIMIKKELSSNLNKIIAIFYIVIYMGCSIVLVNSAASGGELVHTYGVKAKMLKK